MEESDMKKILLLCLCIVFLLSMASCGETIVLVNDAVMQAYEGDAPGTAFRFDFPEEWGAETIQKYLTEYEPVVVHKGDIIAFEVEGAVSSADAFRVCFIDEDGNEVKYTGNATLEKHSFSNDRIVIDTAHWYEDLAFEGQYMTFAYWIWVDIPDAEKPTKIYYLRLQYE
jgi:type II secretory pathway component PulC